MSPISANAPLAAAEFSTANTPEFSVIWLHGLGADGHDFTPIVPELGLSPEAAVRFVFPHAPSLPVTCNGGYIMPAWYDIISLEPHSREVDAKGLLRSREALRTLIARENTRGIPCQRIILAGFSQGGAVAYTTALTHPEPLGGLIALSTYLPLPQVINDEATTANKGVPIFTAHGSFDDIVSPILGSKARDFLSALGYAIDWREYPMPHSVCDQEIIDIGAWLNRRFSPS